MDKRQKQIMAAIDRLPNKIEPMELEALVCAIVSGYVGYEDTPAYLIYLGMKSRAALEAEKGETRH